MALTVQRNISQMKRLVESLGYDVPDLSGRSKKEPLIKVLQEHYLKEIGGMSESMKIMMELGSPMVCSRLNQLSEVEQEELWDSDEYYFELKEDGHRNLTFFIDGEMDHFSRHLSVTDYLPISYGNKIWMPLDKSKIKDNFVLDNEVISTNPNINTVMGKEGVVTETQLQAVSALLGLNREDSLRIQKSHQCPLQLHLFDCIWWNGEWLINRPLKERRYYLSEAYKQLREAGANVALVPCTIKHKKDFYQRIMEKKLEGVVAKNINGIYIPTENRGHKLWVKIKGFMQERLAFHGKISDTIDGFVEGFIPGKTGTGWEKLVGALKLWIYVDDAAGNIYKHWIATPANFTLDERKVMTVIGNDGKPELNPSYYGKVYEFNGQAVSSRSNRFKHATVVRERTDKSAQDCVYPESLIKEFIL